jgi:hypothetical protein
MEIIIDNKIKISEIQNEFQKQFPFLKIEFYKEAHTAGEGSLLKNTLDTALTIGEIQKKNLSESIKITGLMKVSELESLFTKIFGLSVQVFRKSGNVWLQTTATDNWTLAEQNQKGGETFNSNEEKIIDSMDRQELE